jgi:uncharacterized protein YdeI (BOF family)
MISNFNTRFAGKTIILFLIPLFSLAQNNPYEDTIENVISSKKDNQSVLFTAIVTQWEDDTSFSVEDRTGSIKVIFNTTGKPDLISGDEISIRGKVQINDQGEKEILMTSYRKIKFVKDPSNCCKPEVD